ncbi:E6 [Leptonychotes weddellii papillomavirus 4]|uniref:Protein E6 n=1 Tax=Leptonychotes weddellii papillomavirus 4 TaxID=2077305 RepID=A0A2I8B2Q6_9PAPI|nr:E6 [Leptonychotes weddellii papillomavirus 4]AUT11923.1 E6 [Leptonychotes weddellii papillomavirus 4]
MERSTTVLELAEKLEVPLEDLLVRCLFCQTFLDFASLCHQVYADLQLVWKGREVHGSCVRCARASGTYEVSRFLETSTTGETLREQGVNIFTECIRCLWCLRRLSLTEKIDLSAFRHPVHKVRGRWRALCRVCKNDWERTNS